MKFNKDSEKIITLLLPFYEKTIMDKNNKLSKTKQKTYTGVVKKLHSMLLKANTSVELLKKDNDNYKYRLESITKSKNNIPRASFFNSSYFVPDVVRRYVNENSKKYLVYECRVNKRIIYIYFVIFDDNDEYSIYDNYVTLMLTWLHIADNFQTKKCGDKLSIYIYLTPFKKMLPQGTYRTLDSEHVNTAVTTSCSKNGEIVVYRLEEWFKVFIHETFHILGLDFSSMYSDRISMRLKKIFPVDSEMLVFEAYTEMWAELLNCMFYSFDLLDNKNDFKQFNMYFEFCCELERLFSTIQVIKILNYMGLTYRNLYEKDDKSKILRDNLYKEKTNVFPYYILKLILIFNYKQFILWCKSNNETLLKFTENASSLNSFFEFFEKYHDSDAMLAYINEVFNYMYELQNKNLEGKIYLFQNMRMTVCNFF